jgi:hypothetical protein
MVNDMVMRSVYLRLAEDSKLRQLAHELNVSKSDLIRSAISVKLQEWLASNSDELILHDLAFGRRDPRTAAAGDVATGAEDAADTSSPTAPAATTRGSRGAVRTQTMPRGKPSRPRGRRAAAGI